MSLLVTCRMQVKSGFKNGIKNLGSLLFKTFIVDIDDIKNWRALSLSKINPYKNWVIDGEQLIPNANIIPGYYNPDKLSMEAIMKQEQFSRFPDIISFPDQNVDLSKFSVIDPVDIDMRNIDFGKRADDIFNFEISEKDFSDILREVNFGQADAGLPNGVTRSSLEQQLGFKLTWHEDLVMRKCYLVPTIIHANVGHMGAVGNYKFIFRQIPGISTLIGEKSIRLGAEGIIYSLFNAICQN